MAHDPETSSHDPSAERPLDQAPQHIELLRGHCARDILVRLVDGDPLELAARCRARQTERAVLVENHRLCLRTAARVAYAAARYRETPPFATWLCNRIDEAIIDIIREEREADRCGSAPPDATDPRFQFLSQILGIDLSLARKACIAFNMLSQEIRVTMWALLVHGKTIDQVVAEGGVSSDRVRKHVRLAFDAMHRATKIERNDRGMEGPA